MCGYYTVDIIYRKYPELKVVHVSDLMPPTEAMHEICFTNK